MEGGASATADPRRVTPSDVGMRSVPCTPGVPVHTRMSNGTVYLIVKSVSRDTVCLIVKSVSRDMTFLAPDLCLMSL